MIRSVSSILLLVLIAHGAMSQELTCQVNINSQQVQTTERAVFDEMEEEFTDFLNELALSEDRFENQEKIKCIVQITLESSPEIGIYTGAVQIISVRPVYNTNYETTMINFADRDFNFEYTQAQPLNFNENTYNANITSMLGYYALMILGYDYDSFTLMGGDPFFDKARQVVNSAQASNQAGWDQFNSVRNRYWWLNNINDPLMKPFREAMYEYHLRGMDIMTEKPDEARATILEALKKIQQVNQAKPRSILVISFIDAKAEELVKVFSEGETGVRRQVYEILRKIDPSKTEQFKEIITGPTN